MKTKINDTEALARLEHFDPTAPTITARDRSETADIRAAKALAEHAQTLVDQAVSSARKSGVSWVEIGLALGISPQGARQRYLIA